MGERENSLGNHEEPDGGYQAVLASATDTNDTSSDADSAAANIELIAEEMRLIDEIEAIISRIDDPAERERLRRDLHGAKDVSALRDIRNVATAALGPDYNQKTQNQMQWVDADILQSIELDEERERDARARAMADLRTQAGLTSYIATFGYSEEEAAAAAADLRETEPELINRIENYSVEEQERGEQRRERFAQIADNIANPGPNETHYPENVRAFARELLETPAELHRFGPAREMLLAIESGAEVSQERLNEALRAARADHAHGVEEYNRRQQERRPGVAPNPVAAEMSINLQVLEADIAGHNIDYGRGLSGSMGALYNRPSVTGGDMRLSEAERRQQLDEILERSPTYRNQTPAERAGTINSILAQTQPGQASPEVAAKMNVGVLESDEFTQAMKDGRNALINGRRGEAEAAAGRVSRILRDYGYDDERVTLVTNTLMEGARIGSTPQGRAYLVAIGEEEAINSQRRLITHGEIDGTMRAYLASEQGDNSVALDAIARNVGLSSFFKQEVEGAIARINAADPTLARAIGGRDGLSTDEYIRYLQNSGVLRPKRQGEDRNAYSEYVVETLDRNGDGQLETGSDVSELLTAMRTGRDRMVRRTEANTQQNMLEQASDRASDALALGGDFGRAINTNVAGYQNSTWANMRGADGEKIFDIDGDGRVELYEVRRVLEAHGIRSASQVDSAEDMRAAMQRVQLTEQGHTRRGG